MNIGAIVKGKLGRNVGSTLLAQGVSWACALLVTLFLPTYLGSTGFGKFMVATAFSGTFAVLINFGVSTVLVREIARHPEQTIRLVRTALLLRAGLGVLTLAVGTLAAGLLGYAPDQQLLIVICLVSGWAGQLADVLASALRGREEFPKQNAAALAEKLLVSVVSIGLVFLHAPIWAFAAVYFAGALVAGAICWWALASMPTPVPGAGAAQANASGADALRDLAVAGLPFMAAMLFVAIYSEGSSAILLSKLSTLQAVAWYGVARRVSGAAQMIPVAVAGVLLPVLSRLHAENKGAEFGRTVRRMALGMLALAVPVSAALILLPSAFLRLLHYPADFAGAVPVLQVSGAVLVLWFLQQAIGTALIACDGQKVFSRVTGIAAAAAFPVCGAGIWLGQHYLGNGAVGAVASDAVLEVYMLTSYALALPPGTLWNAKAPASGEVQEVAA